MHTSSNTNRTTFITLALIILQAAIACSAFARARPPLPLWPEAFLNVWRFDDTQWWMPPYPLPAAVDNIQTVESWSGYALSMRTDKPARLAYPCVDTAGRRLVTFETGTVRFWFAPAWSSGESGPANPQSLGRFIEAGQWTADASAGWWSLYLNPDRTAVYFSAHAKGQGADFLKAPIDWRAGEWHLVTLTYSPTATALYVDESPRGPWRRCFARPLPSPPWGRGPG